MNAGFLQDIVNLGTNLEESVSEKRRIKNSNLLSLIAAFASCLVSIFYFFLQMYVLGFLVLLMAFYFSLNILLTQYGYNKAARNFCLIATNMTLFFGASVLGRESGVVFIYYPLVCLGIFYFGANEKLLTALFLLMCFVSIQLLELTDYSFFKSHYNSPEFSNNLYTLHLSVGIFLTGFFVYYIFINILESEEVLSKSKHSFQTIFNNSSDALFIVNNQTMIIEDCNEKAVEIFEVRSKSELVRSRCTSVLTSDYNREDIKDIIEEVKKSREWDGAVRLSTKKGKPFWGNISIRTFTIEKEEVIYIRINDITTRVMHEEKLMSDNSELQSFVYKSSHNLKGPSTSILGLISIAQKEISDPQCLKYLKMIEQTSQRLDSTLMDLLNITKIKQGEAVSTKIDFQKIINDIIEDMHYFPGFNEVKISTFIEPVEMYADQSILKSILQNLIENGIKYRDKSKESYLNIKVRETNHVITLEFADNGIGIPGVFHNKIFDMFFRAHEVSHGTGLGLYIVKNGIEKLHGTISVESKERTGTIFTIDIPKIPT